MCTVENKVQCEIVHTCSGNSQLSNIISIIFLDMHAGMNVNGFM